MSSSSTSLLNVITHYQKSIEKSTNDEARLIHCIDKLFRLPVTVEHLQATGVGKTVNSLRKYEREVGVAAKALVAKWKAMVAAEEEQDINNCHADPDPPEHDRELNHKMSERKSSHSSERSRNHLKHNNDDKKQNNSMHNGNNYGYSHSHERHEKHRREINEDNHSSKNGKSDNRNHEKNKDKYQRRHESHKMKETIAEDQNGYKKRSYSDMCGDEDTKIPEDQYGLNKSEGEKYELMLNTKRGAIDMDSDKNEDNYDDEDEEKLIIDVPKEMKTDEHRSIYNTPPINVKSLDNKNSHHSYKYNKSSDKYKTDDRNRSHNSRHSSSGSNEKEKSRNREKDSKKPRHHSSDREQSQSRKRDHDKKQNDKSTESSIKSTDKKSSKDATNIREDISSHKSSPEGNHYKKSEHKSKHREKDHHERKRESEKRERNFDDDKKRRRRNSDSDSKDTKLSTLPKQKIPKVLIDEIDCSMGTSFEDALGMIGTTQKRIKSPKMNNSSTASSSINTQSSSNSSIPNSKPILSSVENKTPNLLSSKVKLQPLDASITLDLPTISPNYKPMPLNPTVMECVFSVPSSGSGNKSQKRMYTDEEALAVGISSKTMRTKIYSGVKSTAPQQVPSLYDLCIRILQKHIDGLEYTGGVPFDILRPVLERATPQQLLNFEDYNPYLMEDSDILWKQHCERQYRGQKRLEMETWRDMFLRCKEEQELKLSALTENIKQLEKQKALPVRKTQLAYIDTMVKPPRNILKKQEQFGTRGKLAATPAARVAALSSMTPNATKAGDSRLRINVLDRDTAQASSHYKPKKAPLMQKTLQFMRGRFKR